MSQKFTASLLLLVFFIFSFGSSYSQSKKTYKHTVLDGSEVGKPRTKNATQPSYTDNNYQPLTVNNYTVNYTPFGLVSYYDLQSNGTPNEIWQDPVNPLLVHAAFMVMSVFGQNIIVRYYFSGDRGLTWDYLGNVSEEPGGFPSIDGFKNTGIPIITAHTTTGGLTEARSQVFVDQGIGFGAFLRLDPGLANGNSQIWGRIIETGSLTKWVLTNSQNSANIASTTTGLPSPWLNYPSRNAEQYCLALGQDGRIGNAFMDSATLSPNAGDVKFRESMDGGLSWSTPITIFDANIDADSLGAFGGITMVYLGNTPCVTFEIDNLVQAPTIGLLPSFIYYWSPAINGGVAKKIAGPHNVPFFPNTGPTASYGVYPPLCRPAIGKANSESGNILFLAMNASTNQTAADLNVYYATYFTWSANGGDTWVAPEKITPVTPLKDYRYVSMSQTNSMNTSGLWKVQMLVETHDYAGAFAPNEPPGPCDLVSMTLDVGLVGINEISNSVPNSFSLKQNYPNPFNPSTSIGFDIQRSTRVTLEVYSSNGQKVETLINNELIEPGTKEVSFTGSNLSSGIYLYTLSAGDFKETKKMMLIK